MNSFSKSIVLEAVANLASSLSKIGISNIPVKKIKKQIAKKIRNLLG
jgi:hypothetical protein|tara:strand:+ start:1390 stop:1530 length:141 start_codon:yes stop_codon:yes gene_type:complete